MSRHLFKLRFKQLPKFLSVVAFLLSFALVVSCNSNPAEETFTAVPTVTLSAQTTSVSCGSPSGGPTNNPIAEQYGAEALSWTNDIKWDCVYNIEDFDGSSMGDRFNAARDAASANNGGVVYFPAGTYSFTDDILLKNGVVVRGETPSSTDAKSSFYNPSTKFEFPKYEPRLSDRGTPNNTAFKNISTTTPDTDSNIGIVNIDINRAGIHFIGDFVTGENKNLIVFGVRSNNVAQPDGSVPDVSFQEPWMRYSDRFAANIKINAYANVLVSNNRLNDAITDDYEQPGYKVQSLDGESIVTYAEGNKVPFVYTNHYGIVVNRSKSGNLQYASEPNVEPGLFREGVTIQNNWIYKTMRVGIHASGSGLVIKSNIIRDQNNKQWWTDPRGLKQPHGSNTLENRGIDWSGWNVLIEGNDYEIYRHQIMDSRYFSVDGEGILIQECCGGTSINQVVVRNNKGNSYIGLYKVPDIKNVLITDNELSKSVADASLIFISADTNRGSNSMSDVRIESNRINGSILAKASSGGSGNVIRNNKGDDSGSIEYSCHIQLSDNSGFEVEPCSN